MAKFKSNFGSLTLQDDGGVWAQFEGGEFETNDTKVAARLRKAEGVEEVKPSKSED